MEISTKFSLGERAYYVIYATASIYPVDITNVYMRSGKIFYNLRRTDCEYLLESVSEDQVMTFPEAKVSMLAYLNKKVAEITSLVAP